MYVPGIFLFLLNGFVSSTSSFKTGIVITLLPDDKILDWSKLKQSADDNSVFDVNSIKFSKLVENTVGEGEIARCEQFLLFPQCFQKACFPGVSKGVIVWEWVKHYTIIFLPNDLYYVVINAYLITQRIFFSLIKH